MTARTLYKALAVSTCFGAAAMFGASAWAEVPESTDPIKIIVNNWTSQVVLANVTGTLLKRMGYNVEYKPSDTQLQFTAMGNGDMDVQVEVWEGTMRTPFEKEVAAGRMIDAGAHSAKTREEWWYPTYVEDVCPGLPDWHALLDENCAKALGTPETLPKGRYLAGPVDWEKPDQERVDALHLPIEVVNAGQASTLWAELDAAYKRKEPIMLFNWTPNWVEAEYDGKFVDFPDHDARCETDASWGENPDATYDCGNPKAGWLKKGVWAGMKDKWPCAEKLIENIDFTNAMIADAAAKVDVGGMEPEDAAEKWLEENKETADSWIPGSCS
jgi:glycine betaine/proline transport system substrate-binding protein